MRFYLLFYIFIYLQFINSVTIPLNGIPAGQIVSVAADMIPLHNKLGTAGNVVKNLAQGKSPIPPVKANYHKFKMIKANQKEHFYQELQKNINLSKSSTPNAGAANRIYQQKAQYYQAMKDNHAEKYQSYKEKDKSAKNIWFKSKII